MTTKLWPYQCHCFSERIRWLYKYRFLCPYKFKHHGNDKVWSVPLNSSSKSENAADSEKSSVCDQQHLSEALPPTGNHLAI